MNSTTPSLNSVPDHRNSHSIDHCRHLTTRGRHCRSRAVRSGFCFRHAALQLQASQPVDVDLSADFLLKLEDLQTAEQINLFLAKLLMLVVQNRISPRRAAVLTYITNQLLHSLAVILREEGQEKTEIIFDMPGPDRDMPGPDRSLPPGDPGKS